MLDKDAILQIRGSCDCNGGKLDDENRGRINRKLRFDFFSRNFRHLTTHTLPPPLFHLNHRRTLEFAILNLHETFLEIYSWQYRICESRNYGGGGDANHGQKNRKHQQALKNCLKCERDKSPAKSTDIKPLDLVAIPIWLGNLQCGRAFRTFFQYCPHSGSRGG